MRQIKPILLGFFLTAVFLSCASWAEEGAALRQSTPRPFSFIGGAEPRSQYFEKASAGTSLDDGKWITDFPTGRLVHDEKTIATTATNATTFVPRSASGKPEVWLCAGEGVWELLREDADWSFVKRNLAGIKLYVDMFAKAQPEKLARLAKLIKDNGFQVSVELGCCLDFAPKMDDTAGEWSAAHEISKLDKWYAAGGRVDYLDMDGPVRRLMFPDGRRDGGKFESMEAAANEVVDSVRAFHAAYPEMKFWHLTNFPNWGYKGDVSYHARGPARQDYGEYDDAHRLVYEKLIAAGLPLAGVTIDNPYEYLIGERPSATLTDPKSVNWLARVRAYEDRCRVEGLEVNLIVNSERGGSRSDELFCQETLKMVETYRQAGGRPNRWIVQTWYEHPKTVVPETEPYSMTGLVKAVLEAVR